MIDNISDILNEHLENLAQWFLDYFFSPDSTNTGGSAFRFLFDRLLDNVLSFKTVLFVCGVWFTYHLVKLIISLLRG